MKQMGCEHYHSSLDIVEIRFKCCGAYFPCYFCHQKKAGHEAVRWKKEEFGEQAIRCGACGGTLTIEEYLAFDSICLHCGAGFNRGCRNHWDLYFE